MLTMMYNHRNIDSYRGLGWRGP